MCLALFGALATKGLLQDCLGEAVARSMCPLTLLPGDMPFDIDARVTWPLTDCCLGGVPVDTVAKVGSPWTDLSG